MSANQSRFALLLVVVVALAACAPQIHIASDYDPSADFARMKTYAWLQTPAHVPQDPRINSDLLASRVHSAVNDELTVRGYAESVEKPDFRVTYHVAVKDKIDVQSFPTDYGYGLGRWPAGSDVRVAQYEEGMLLLDLVDGETNELIWRGSAQARIDPNRSPAERTKLIRSAVHQMLDRFPPKR
jgi:hypothetical protein